MLERAREAIEEQDVKGREYNSLMLPFDINRINEIKTFIREFRDRFHTSFEEKGSSTIGQLSIQFFAHTYSTDELN
jgi:Mg2+/Co2+ transporter CorC